MNKQKVQENLLRRKRLLLRNKLKLFLGWFGVLTPALAGIGLWIFWVNGGVFTQVKIVPVSIGSAINFLIGLLLLTSWKRSQSPKGVKHHA